MADTTEIDRLAEVAYQASHKRYGVRGSWFSAWENLAEDVRKYWREIVRAVLEAQGERK